MIVQLSNDDGSLADSLQSYKYQKQMEGEGIVVENSSEKERVCRNKVYHLQEMTLAYSNGLYIS